MKPLTFYLAFLFILPLPALADWRGDLIQDLKNGSIYVEDQNGKQLLSYRSDDMLIPASVLKVTTAACALNELGSDYRFKTRFFLDKEDRLYIKGGGDPSITSEVLSTIAKDLTTKSHSFNQIVIDGSLFSSDLTIDGASNTSNPYDAPNGPFIVNFNTIMVNKLASGKVMSGEPQTPLTERANSMAKKLPIGIQRVNIGKDPRQGALYGAELLTEFLRRSGVTVRKDPMLGLTPDSAHLLYQYSSVQTLEEILKGLLEFSTNFSANQIFLLSGAHRFGGVATIDKGRQALTECLGQHFGWKRFTVQEGAGLSRKNLVTTKEVVELLKKAPVLHNLLPTKGRFIVKTGTLTGVNSLAGYVTLTTGEMVTFAMIVNSDVASDYKFYLADKLLKGLERES